MLFYDKIPGIYTPKSPQDVDSMIVDMYIGVTENIL